MVKVRLGKQTTHFIERLTQQLCVEAVELNKQKRLRMKHETVFMLNVYC